MMNKRVALHIGFWSFFLLVNSIADSLFPAVSDQHLSYPSILVRYMAMELFFLPWKMLPFYILFYYLLPTSGGKGFYRTVIYFVLVLVICIFCFRSLVPKVNQYFYGDEIDFNAFSVNRMLYTFLDILPGFALASAIKLFRNKLFHEQRENELKAQKQEVEIQLMKARFNPHFLFNTLNNLYGLTKKDNAMSSEYILRLSGIMRYILEEGKKDRVAISEEVQLLENYIALEKLRYDDRLELTFQKNILQDKAITPLLLLTFVENAFKHGAGEAAGQTYIHLQLTVEEDQLDFSVENSKTQVSDMPGNGLTIVRKQLELIYPGQHQLEITESEDFYRIRLTLKI